MDTRKIISEITEIFIQQGVDRVILFGSHAYGNTSNDSDIDLVIVVHWVHIHLRTAKKWIYICITTIS